MTNFDLHDQAQQLADTRSAYSLAWELLTLLCGIPTTETIRTAPKRIWLQVGDDAHYHTEPFPEDTSSVTWCADSVAGCEVPYVRADIAMSVPPERVRKTGGSFQHTGVVVSRFHTTAGEPRIVLEFDAPVDGMLHIYRPDQVGPV